MIDYYGDKDNYIHLKFGDCRKCYFFTKSFIKKYPLFAEEYRKYFELEDSQFRNVFQVMMYIFNNKIPVHLYYNFTDTPAKGEKEVMDYLMRENNMKKLY